MPATVPLLARPATARALLGSLALALLCAAGAAAQTAAPPADSAAPVVFTGRVLDRATGRPIARARVELASAAQLALTDSTGAFRIDGITGGEHDLAVAAAGYQPVAARVALSPAMPAVDIPLAPAEDAGPAVPAELSGRVLEAGSGTPVAGARVEFVDAGQPTRTDSTGAFRLASARSGSRLVRVRAVGYPTRTSQVQVGTGAPPATLELERDVVMLEGLRVMVDRMERRRLSVGVSSRLAPAQRLAASNAVDMKSFMREEFGLRESSCGALRRGGGTGCVLVRGAPANPVIRIDDVPVVGGITTLEMYKPSDFARVEMYAGGRIMLLYTVNYMERQARSKNPPMAMPLY